jgi:hypothetical protein
MKDMKPISNAPEYSKANMKRSSQEAVAAWLRPIAWDTVATLTFPREPSALTAVSKFDEMINELEATLRTRVGYVVGHEIYDKGGNPVQRHLHSVMTAAKPISCDLVVDLWRKAMGRSNDDDSDLALVTPYNADGDALGYITKQIASEDGDWDLRNIEHFDSRLDSTPTGRGALRAARRLQDQVNGVQSVRKVSAIDHAKSEVGVSAAPSVRIKRISSIQPLKFQPRSTRVVIQSIQKLHSSPQTIRTLEGKNMTNL